MERKRERKTERQRDRETERELGIFLKVFFFFKMKAIYFPKLGLKVQKVESRGI